ncbi:MAG: gas vesicle protein GvpK, partial [candidate division NC10 bacterium]
MERSIGAVPSRINADPERVEQGLAKLVLTLIELLRRLLE